MSAASVASSRRSGGRYRTIARSSEVDESLFGNPGARAGGQSAVLRGAGSRTMGASSRDGGRQAGARRGRGAGAGGAAAAAPVVLRASDVMSMRERATVRSAKEEEAMREAAATARRSRATLGEKRKAKMAALEAARLAAEPLTELEQEEAEDRGRSNIKAAHLTEEAKDAVKAMNSMVKYAQTVTIRDRQLIERRERLAREKDQERLLDMEVELRRLEEVKRFRDIEEQQRERQRKAQLEIRAQLEEAEARKRAAKEALRRESEEAAAKLKRMAEEDRVAELDRRAAKARLREEVREINEAATRLRKEEEAKAVEADRALEAEQRAATERAIEAEMEKERVRLRREAEFFKLRGLVEKFQDDSEAQAETRMRRAFEEGQRRDREAAARKREREAEEAAALRVAREAQIREKELLRAAEIAQERATFDAAQAARSGWVKGERETRQRRRDADRSHVKDVLRQAEASIAQARERSERERAEGAVGLRATDEEMAHLAAVRDRKVAELAKSGVESKYAVQLRRFNPRSALDKDFKMGPPRAGKSKAAAKP